MIWVLAVLLSVSLHAMDDCDYKIVKRDKRSSTNYEKNLEQAFLYFLGKNGPRFSKDLAPRMRKKVKESQMSDKELYDIMARLDPHEIKLSDSQDLDIKLKELRRIVTDCVEDALQKKEEEATEAKMELVMANKVLKTEKYKYYGALVGLAAVSLTSIITIVTLFLEKN